MAIDNTPQPPSYSTRRYSDKPVEYWEAPIEEMRRRNFSGNVFGVPTSGYNDMNQLSGNYLSNPTHVLCYPYTYVPIRDSDFVNSNNELNPMVKVNPYGTLLDEVEVVAPRRTSNVFGSEVSLPSMAPNAPTGPYNQMSQKGIAGKTKAGGSEYGTVADGITIEGLEFNGKSFATSGRKRVR